MGGDVLVPFFSWSFILCSIAIICSLFCLDLASFLRSTLMGSLESFHIACSSPKPSWRTRLSRFALDMFAPSLSLYPGVRFNSVFMRDLGGDDAAEPLL